LASPVSTTFVILVKDLSERNKLDVNGEFAAFLTSLYAIDMKPELDNGDGMS
jgi:hypothetical protein